MAPLQTVVAALVLVVIGIDGEHTKLEWTDCGTDSNAIVLNNVAISPMPIEVPGNLSLTIDAVSKMDINRANLKVSVKRHTFIGDVTIPCLFHVGSCEYQDTCTLLDRMEKENWAGIMGGIGTQIKQMLQTVGITSYCGVTPRSIGIQSYNLKLPPIPAILTFFAEGDYTAHVTVEDDATKQQKICLDLKLSIKKHKDTTCTGWLCGRKRRNVHF
ncbi:hypothetical protein SNE40_022330 [Patella caerulea]|uniref:MD-2-related lipid-recognition domain-containing protein n=1 Tax=Patella caerulea TaxID=87958 RepID=A0AAN8FW70_PATCE